MFPVESRSKHSLPSNVPIDPSSSSPAIRPSRKTMFPSSTPSNRLLFSPPSPGESAHVTSESSDVGSLHAEEGRRDLDGSLFSSDARPSPAGQQQRSETSSPGDSAAAAAVGNFWLIRALGICAVFPTAATPSLHSSPEKWGWRLLSVLSDAG